MKYRLLIVVVILYLLTALPTSAQTTSTLTPTASGSYVTASDIYVRGGPGSAYLPVGRLVAGDLVMPLNRSVNGIWVMIQYNRGYGWVRRDLAAWIDDIDALPTLDETTLTPTTLVSETPTAAPTGVQVNAGAEGAFVRFGPGVNYPFLGAIVTGDYVEPVGRNVEGDWLLIRFRGGFGWIARNLVNGTVELNRLPVLLPDALTPSVTFTASVTPRFTATATSSATPSPMPTLIPTNTSLPATTAPPSNTATRRPLPTNTVTLAPTATLTLTNTPSDTATATSSATLTPTHTSTPMPTFTASDVPTRTASSTATATPAPTDTATPSASATSTPTHTASQTRTFTPTQTATITFTPSPPPTEVAAQIIASDTPLPTDTPLPPSSTNTPLPTSTATPSPTATPSGVSAAAAATAAPPTPVPAETPAPETPEIPPEVIVGAALFVLVVGYVALYWRALTVGERYAEGFVIERCPVCQQGHLTVENRPARVLGIPRPQAIVRCDNCRSVLREVGRRRWRYAVDRAANLTLYNQLNGRIVNEETLRALEESAPRQAPPVRPLTRPPAFVDDEE